MVDHHPITGADAPRGAGVAKDSTRRFLRQCHIFGAAVRQILDRRFLAATSRQRISLPQFRLLQIVARAGRHHVSEIAAHLGISPPAASKTIDRLERKGLVRRATDATDRRATWLTVSPSGRRLVTDYDAHKRAHVAPVLAGFSDEELQQFAGFLERFSVALMRRERPVQARCLCCASYDEPDCPLDAIHGRCPYAHIHERTGSGTTHGAEPRDDDNQ